MNDLEIGLIAFLIGGLVSIIVLAFKKE